MAKNKKGTESIPRQEKFFHEMSGNQSYPATSRPMGNATTGHPGEFPCPTVRTCYEMDAAGGEFMHRSNTKGRG